MTGPHANLLPFRVTLADQSRPLPAHALARVHFGPAASAASDPRDVLIPLQTLAPPHSQMAEVWLSDLPVATGSEGALRYAENGEVVMGSIVLPDCGPAQTLEQLGYEVYCRIEDFCATRGYRHLLRAWNFLSGINEGEDDFERYRQFSLGRFRAFSRRPDFASWLPAGTAIGTHTARASSELIVHFLAARTAGTPVENPRQVSAFAYPREYGPRPPSFSRAMFARGQLLVSGTASIVGHQTLHRGDVRAQLFETFENLKALLGEAARAHDLDLNAAHPEAIKLYLRHPAHLPLIERDLAELFHQAPVLVLHGDICRADLDLEIEGVWRIPAGAAP